MKKEEGRFKQRFNITLYESDHDYIVKFCKEKNISFSEWVENKILEEYQKQLKNDKNASKFITSPIFEVKISACFYLEKQVSAYFF